MCFVDRFMVPNNLEFYRKNGYFYSFSGWLFYYYYYYIFLFQALVGLLKGEALAKVEFRSLAKVVFRK